MGRFYPTMYQKTIHDINYSKLKAQGIRCLIFDLDNTIALLDQNKVDIETKKLFQRLEKEFQLVIISNNVKKRVKPYAENLNCDFVSFAMKPFRFGYWSIIRKYHLKKEEMAMIGDQLITDIYVGNGMTGCTILVDPLGKKDLKVTSLNRFLEKKIFKYFEKTKQMTKGVYYE